MDFYDKKSILKFGRNKTLITFAAAFRAKFILDFRINDCG